MKRDWRGQTFYEVKHIWETCGSVELAVSVQSRVACSVADASLAAQCVCWILKVLLTKSHPTCCKTSLQFWDCWSWTVKHWQSFSNGRVCLKHKNLVILKHLLPDGLFSSSQRQQRSAPHPPQAGDSVSALWWQTVMFASVWSIPIFLKTSG